MPTPEQVLYVTIASISIITLSMIGVLLAWKGLRKWFQNHLPYLVSFSAGVFLVVSWHLVEEVFEFSDSLLLPISVIIIGAIATHSITKFFPGSHHHEHPDCSHDHDHVDARSMFLGDSFHSAADGMLLAPAFLISPILGLTTALGIAFHEIVQELSEFFVYKKAGFSTKKALAWNIMSSSTLFIGAAIGLFITQLQALVVPLLGFAAGSFLYIVLIDLIPDSYRAAKGKVRSKSKYTWHIFAILLGLIVMLAIFEIGE